MANRVLKSVMGTLCLSHLRLANTCAYHGQEIFSVGGGGGGGKNSQKGSEGKFQHGKNQ